LDIPFGFLLCRIFDSHYPCIKRQFMDVAQLRGMSSAQTLICRSQQFGCCDLACCGCVESMELSSLWI